MSLSGSLVAVIPPRRMLPVAVQRYDQQRLDKQGGIIRLNDDDSAFANGDEIGVSNRDSAPVRQTNVERLERLSA
jgi:hypothetical protein